MNHVKNRLRWIAAALICMVLLGGCAAGMGSDLPAQTPAAELSGRIVRVQEGSVLIASEQSGLISVDRNGVLEDWSDEQLVCGDMLYIGFDGAIMESYPARISGAVTARTEPGSDLVGLYLEIIADLWEQDDALNSGIDYLAMDLTQAANLSEAEKEAVSWLAATDRELTPLRGSFEELGEQGYIDTENLYFEDGVLFSFTTTDEEETGFRFNAQKWRSGLGALMYNDCKAQLSDGRWSYELGGFAIA